MKKSFSVVTSVYKNDNPAFVRLALDSMLIYQTIKPQQVVLVQDGWVSEDMEHLLLSYEEKYRGLLDVIRLNKNGGLGNAMRIGVENAKYELVARMDCDDICLPNRFDVQLSFFEANPNVDIIGGQIAEFIDTPENIIGKRMVPYDNEDIYKYMKKRCGLNHMTVMFKRNAVLQAGNYQDWFWNEDYYLWIRMMMNNCVFANVPVVLVYVRSGLEQYKRRGGKRYYESEKGIKKIQLQYKMISKYEYYVSITQRYILQRLLPNSVRGWLLRTFARQKN